MKNRLFVTGILVFVILMALDIGLRSELFSTWLRPIVTGYLQKSLGQKVSIGGVQAGLVPPRLEVRDIFLQDDDQIRALAGIRKVRAYLNPLPLLFKRISLTSIVLIEPQFIMEKRGTAALDVLSYAQDRFHDLRGPEQPRQEISFPVIVHAVIIRNGTIIYHDALAGSQYAVRKLTARAHREGGDERSFRLSIQNADISISKPALPDLRMSARMKCGYSGGKLSLETFSVSSRDSWLEISGTAVLSERGALALKLRSRIGTASIGQITRTALPQKIKTSLDIAADITGALPAPSVNGSVKINDVVIRGISLRNADLTFTYRDRVFALEGTDWKLVKGDAGMTIKSVRTDLAYHEAGIMIRSIKVSGDGLESSLSGRLDFRYGYDVAASLELSEENKALAILTGISMNGKVSVSGRFSGVLEDPKFSGILAAGPVTVRSVPFEHIRGALDYQGRTITISGCEIRQQTSRYSLNGSVDLKGGEPLFDAQLDAIRADVKHVVALFYRKLPLEITARGQLSFHGTPGKYAGSGYITADSGIAYGETFGNATLKVTLSTGMITFDQGVAYKGSGVVKGQGWIAFAGSYSASIQARYVDLAEVDYIRFLKIAGPFKLDIESSGAFKDLTLDSIIDTDRLVFDGSTLGPARVQVAINDRTLEVKGAIPDGRGDLTARLAVTEPYTWSVSFAVRADGVDPFLLFGRKDLADRMKADITGNVSANGRGKDLSRISAFASVPRLKLDLGEYWIENERPIDLAIQEGLLKITSFDMHGPATRLHLTGRSRLGGDIDMKMRGSANLSMLRIVFKEIERSDGMIDLNLTAGESWTAPEISGELVVRDGMLKMRDIPQTFTAISGTVSLSEGRVLVDSVRSQFGGGSIEANGWTQLDGMKLRDISLHAIGKGITVRYPEGVVSNVSGDLYYEGNASEQQLSGDIEILHALYEKRLEWKTMLLELAKGIYQKKTVETGWIGNTMLNVRFHGKESVLLRNNLAKIPMDVDVQLRGTINKLQLVGRMEAQKGAIFFRNNDFKILHASVDFIDPARLNPVLDIQAETRVREYLIRLAVTGTAERAVVTFLSEPPLSDPDILGVLALGKTGTELKGKEAGVGMGEAVSFATGQFQDIFEKRARSLTGLDRFQVDPYVGKSDTSVPRVTVGKEIIKDKLFVTYSSNVGASTPEPALKLEYILNRNLSIVGEQNELGKVGADVKFRFEFK